MVYPIDDKLVIGVASSALFKLDEADDICREKGVESYRKYQREHEQSVLDKGIAFPFIRRFLELNNHLPGQPVEVVLLSHNDPDSGQRVFNSIRHYDLPITRAAFLNGGAPFEYILPYNVSLFLSANFADVKQALQLGYAAGQVLDSANDDAADDWGLRIAFDFDGVVVDDSAEKVNLQQGLNKFYESEQALAQQPMQQGPLGNLFRKLGKLAQMEQTFSQERPDYRKFISMALVTARSAPAQERVVTTLRDWEITVDKAFFLGGMSKGKVLSVLKPHIFFDDQSAHLERSRAYTPSVFIPFGCSNEEQRGN